MVDYEKMKVGDLKNLCKGFGLVTSGDKGTLIWRIKLKEKCDAKNLKAFDGSSPCQLTEAKLRTACAKEGVSCIGNKDEMLELLVNHLSSKAPAPSSSSSGDGSSSSSNGGKVDPVAVAKRIMELDEVDDFAGILNIASRPGEPPLNHSSSSASMRKAYLKLSLLIHPDKLGRVFSHAAKAFQCLVRALDRLSQAPVEADGVDRGTGKKGKDRQFTIARSNEGCKRTRVCCPRCKERWSERDMEGNPDYYYNFLMMGLKQYYCSTCLCEFGAMSAIHLCPFCNKSYEYSPDDYHRKITCGNESCVKSFGFYMFNTSDQVLSQLKQTVMQEHEARTKTMLAKRRRAERSAGRESVDEEKAFTLGLLDECPRCGESLEDYSEELCSQHLRECINDTKIKEHKVKKAQIEAVKASKDAKRDAQISVQSAAAWKFLGAQSEQLYLLDETQLQKHAKELGLDVLPSSDRADLVEALVSRRSHANSSYGAGAMVLASDDVDSSADPQRPQAKRRKLHVKNLPSNLHSLSVGELRVILASHGLLHLASKSAVKKDLLDIIEGETYEGRDAEKTVLLLKESSEKEHKQATVDLTDDADDQLPKKKGRLIKKSKRILDSSDEEEEEDDDEAEADVSDADSVQATRKLKAPAPAPAPVDPVALICASMEKDIKHYVSSGGDLASLSFNQLKEKLLKQHSAEKVLEYKQELKEFARKIIQASL